MSKTQKTQKKKLAAAYALGIIQPYMKTNDRGNLIGEAMMNHFLDEQALEFRKRLDKSKVYTFYVPHGSNPKDGYYICRVLDHDRNHAEKKIAESEHINISVIKSFPSEDRELTEKEKNEFMKKENYDKRFKQSWVQEEYNEWHNGWKKRSKKKN